MVDVAPRSPVRKYTRRTASAGTENAEAIASSTSPLSAPMRSSPRRRRLRRSHSASVDRARSPPSRSVRSATDPGPVVRASAEKASSISSTDSGGACPSDATQTSSTAPSDPHPTPIRRWRSSPVRNPTTIGSSSSEANERTLASARTFAILDLVDETPAAVSTSDAKWSATPASRAEADHAPQVLDHERQRFGRVTFDDGARERCARRRNDDP